MEKRGQIFDIQSFSVHDGPGCRTNIFLSGCPLKCKWCANPESWIKEKHLMLADNLCKWDNGCRACENICTKNAIRFFEDKKPYVDQNICNDCKSFECVDICPNNVFKQCVREYTVDDIIKILKRDFNNWGMDGGVTFTGGEPLLQSDFLLEILKKCREMQIHTAIETSAYIKEEIFLKIFEYIEFAFIDIKNMNNDKHKEGTGVSNELILSNISKLKKSYWSGRLVLRQPTIEGYNDSDENAYKIIDFMNENSLYEINLLKFHRLGETKWNQLGKDYAFHSGGDISQEKLAHLQQIYLNNNIACYVGDNTPF